MSVWPEAALAAILFIAAAARSANLAPLHADPARRWLVATLVALGTATALHAMLAAGVAASGLRLGFVLWGSDVATMIAAACMVGVVAPDRDRDPHTVRLCAHAAVVSAVALMMGAQLLAAVARHPVANRQVGVEAEAYVLPYVGYLVVALVGTVHGLSQQPPLLARPRTPAITVAIIGGAWAGISGAVLRRVTAIADPPALLSASPFVHLGLVLEVAGHLVLVAGLAAAPAIRARRAWRSHRQYKALGPLWRIVTDAARHAGHVGQTLTGSVAHGHHIDLRYRRIVQICDACHALNPYVPDEDLPQPKPGHPIRFETEATAATLSCAIIACRNGAPPRTDPAMALPVPNHTSVEELASWLIHLGTLVLRQCGEPGAQSAGSHPGRRAEEN